jgi:phosphoribosylamine--glycine ligase
VAQQTLDAKTCTIAPETAVTVVCASGGYPEAYEKGYPVTGWQDVPESLVFHAGTAWRHETLVTAGGRVLAVTALAQNLPAARKKAYAAVTNIRFRDCSFRQDIGADLVGIEK